MANKFVAMCYIVAKKAGVDTSKMDPDEVVEWYKEHNKQGGNTEGGGDKKQELKQAIEKVVSDKNKSVQDVQNASNNNELPSTVDMNDTNSLKSSMKKISDWLANQKEEHAVVIDKDGKVWESKGDYLSVNPPKEANIDGGFVIHNHLFNSTFEEADFMFYRDKTNTTFINVTPNFEFKLNVLKEIDKPYNYFYIRGLDPELDPEEQPENVLKLIQKEGYIHYEKSLRN